MISLVMKLAKFIMKPFIIIMLIFMIVFFFVAYKYIAPNKDVILWIIVALLVFLGLHKGNGIK